MTCSIRNNYQKNTINITKREMKRFQIENIEGGISWKTKITIEIK